MRKQSQLTTGAILALALCAASAIAARAQDVRYTDTQGGISFQPPPGWTHQLLGPARKDGSGPVLTIESQNTALNLSDNSLDSLTREIRDSLLRDGAQGVQVSAAQKRNVAGRDAAQIDLSYKQGDVAVRERRVYVPVSEQNRTYLLTLLDRADQFEQSAAGADSTINSFTLAGASGAGSGWGKDDDARGGPFINLPLLIVLGVIAIALIAWAGYMLVRRRAGAG